jgi:uroporphyrinogen-III synthase
MTTVVLTRAASDSQRLAALLGEQGFKTLCLPLMTLAPLTPQERPDLPEPSDIWIFISANAVTFGLPLIALLLHRETGSTVVAVGAKTREVLSQHDVAAISPERQDSEGLLAMPELSGDCVERVTIVKGEGGRDTLAAELRRRGISVNEFPCYRRCWPEVDLSVLRDKADQWVFQASSGETVSRLTTLLAKEDSQVLSQFPVVVPSDRVAQIATRLGWRTVLRADDASDQSVIRALHHWTECGTST